MMNQSLFTIRILLLLACCSLVSLSQTQSPTINTAIRDGDLKQVKNLLAQGASINAQDADGTTPLMHAVVNAEADCVKLLLDKGADPNLSNKAGATALMWAVNDLKKVQLLLAKGANVNAVSKEKNSPLLLALNLPNALPVVKALLAKGADVNQADANGNTPLMAAGFRGNLELVQNLLAKGADPKAKDGLTALAFAKRKGWAEVIALLTKAASSSGKSAPASDHSAKNFSYVLGIIRQMLRQQFERDGPSQPRVLIRS